MSGYSELIKNFEKIRNITRDFFIYGFKGRGDFSSVSKRSYDNERRRIESYLSGHIEKRRDGKGKTISISSNTAGKTVNPLFKVWETKSFTRWDCFLHFVILDILWEKPKLCVTEMADIISMDYMGDMEGSEPVDAMTVRNKLNEYTKLGILKAQKEGKTLYYSLAENPLSQLSPETAECLHDALDFFKNLLPGGFLGHTIRRTEDSPFIYRQIFFSHALDDEVLLKILHAIKGKRRVTLDMAGTKAGHVKEPGLVPLMVLSNTRTGRRYVKAYSPDDKRYVTIRMDKIKDVSEGDVYLGYDGIKEQYIALMENSFSITTRDKGNLNNLKLRLYIDESTEQYVISRIKREGRQGKLTRVCDNVYEYSIEIADTLEMVPWLRTFIGRIISIEGSEDKIISRFKRDMDIMMSMYGDHKG